MKVVKKKIYLNNDCPKCSGAGNVVLVLNRAHTQHREITCNGGGSGYFQTIQFLWPEDIRDAIEE